MKKIQITTLILLLVIGFNNNLLAQDGPPPPPHHEGGKKINKEKIKAMKVAFITEKLNLTPEEAQKFWPIYNEFDAKMETLHKDLRKTRGKKVNIDEMSDADIEKMIAKNMSLRQKEIDLQKEYHQKFKAVLSIKKVAKLYKSEEDFKRDLLRKLKNHRPKQVGAPQHKKRTSTDF